jgi:hypothetical protein
MIGAFLISPLLPAALLFFFNAFGCEMGCMGTHPSCRIFGESGTEALQLCICLGIMFIPFIVVTVPAGIAAFILFHFRMKRIEKGFPEADSGLVSL